MSLQSLLLLFITVFPLTCVSENLEPLTPFAFANYLGSGIYHAAGEDTTVFNIPSSYEIKKDKQQKLLLNMPLSLGFFNFNLKDLPHNGLPKHIGTITFIPGIKYQKKYSDSLTYQIYTDLGYGKNLTTGTQVGIFSTGVSSLVKWHYKNTDPLWVTRLYYAGYKSMNNSDHGGYSSIHSGIDMGLGKHWYSELLTENIEPRIFMNSYFYFNKLHFLSPFKKQALLSNSVEFGVSLAFSKPILWHWMGINRLGLSYRINKESNVWRLIFDFPL